MRVLSTKDRSAADVLRAVQSNPNVLGIVPADAVNARVRVLTVGGRHPLREPQRYPLHTPSTRPLPEITTITAVGDIMLGRRVGDRHRADPGAPLKPLAKRLASAEITIGNFESTLSTAGSPTQGGDSFAASPRVIPGLRAAGFDLLSLANNHVGDYGDRALRQTLSRFSKSTIDDCRSGTESGPGPQAGDRGARWRTRGVRRGRLHWREPGGHPQPSWNQSIEHATANRSARSLRTATDQLRHPRIEHTR